MIITSLVSGLTFGLEHISPDEDDDFSWGFALHLGIIRFVCLF
jgi:hypothetical protein